MFAALAAFGCSGGDGSSDTSLLVQGESFVASRDARRAALERSVVAPSNSYSARRLSFYAVDPRQNDTSWESRVVWNPAVRPVMAAGAPGLFSTFDVDIEWTHGALLALGARAFAEYPMQPSDAVGAYIRDEEAWQAAGLLVDAAGTLGGLVETQNTNGTISVALTCATCHSSVMTTGQRVAGAPGDFDYGLTLAAGVSDDVANVLLQWGPGRVDVTPTAFDPVAISDLRPIRYQTHLHWAATLRNDLLALAVRVDTLIIDSVGGQRRPPREVSFALAYYLWHLDAEALAADETTAQTEQGRAVFERDCAGCHGDGRTPRLPVALGAMGSASGTGTSVDRGTGTWRVPSLWGVSTRPHLFHDASVRSLAALFEERAPNARANHPFGLELSDEEVAALIAFLETLGDPALER